MDTRHATHELPRILSCITDQSPDAIAVLTAGDWPIGSEVVYANAAYLELSGYREEDLVGHTHYVLTERRPAQRLHDDVHADRLVAERFASIRGLAAGTAYALDAPLSKVLAHVGSALETLDAGTADEGTLRRALSAASEAAALARETVRGLRAFNRHGEEEPIDVHEAIERAAAIANDEVGARAILLRRYSPVDPVMGNLGALANVLVQYCAMPPNRFPPISRLRMGFRFAPRKLRGAE